MGVLNQPRNFLRDGSLNMLKNLRPWKHDRERELVEVDPRTELAEFRTRFNQLLDRMKPAKKAAGGFLTTASYTARLPCRPVSRRTRLKQAIAMEFSKYTCPRVKRRAANESQSKQSDGSTLFVTDWSDVSGGRSVSDPRLMAPNPCGINMDLWVIISGTLSGSAQIVQCGVGVARI